MRVSFTSARMYIGVNFVAREKIMKCVLVFLGLNVQRKAQFCNNTDEAYKLKRSYVELIIVLLFLFCPVIKKLCAHFFLDLILQFFILHKKKKKSSRWDFTSSHKKVLYILFDLLLPSNINLPSLSTWVWGQDVICINFMFTS